MKQTVVLMCACILASGAVAQNVRMDSALFVVPKNAFYDSLNAKANRFKERPKPEKRKMRMDFSPYQIPQATTEFKSYWHSPPVSQGLTGTCWAFSTTSYFESEIYRLSHREIKLSEMYTAYWEYVEKAKRFVKERGGSAFGEGSEANAVTRIWKQYGIVPESAYTGMLPGQEVHDHRAMFKEMQDYLGSVKASNAWSEDAVTAVIRSILDHYMGEPPAFIMVEGKKMTPKDYLEQVVRLPLDDYVSICSFVEKPYYKQMDYEVEDNWWHDDSYYNVPLAEFMSVLKDAIRKGYTIDLGGDTSEPGYQGQAGAAMVPTFDIPASYIDGNARQFRFSNQTSTDDHGIHLVGFKETPAGDWYLIKDSGASARSNSHPGYYFYHEDYVKLKMLDFMVHKDAAEEILKKKID
jgi:bleomycin hydrolase